MKGKQITKMSIIVFNLNPFQVYFVAPTAKASKIHNPVQKLLFLKLSVIHKVIIRVG